MESALGTPRQRAPRAPRVFYRSFLQFVRDLPGTTQRFWLLVAVTGAAAGLGAVLLVELLEAVTRVCWPHADTFLGGVLRASPLRRVLVLAGAGLLVSLVSLLLRRPLGGHGTAGIIESIWVRAGKLPLLRTLLRGGVSIVAVGMGVPLGREGALIQIGAAIGSWLGGQLRVHPDQRRLLVACGAASGIAAAYNVPIGGALFGLEVLLGSFALDLFGPIVVSCVVATTISRILISDHPSYVIPRYALAMPRELLVVAMLGPLLGVASALYTRGIDLFARLADRVREPVRVALPILVMLAVGVLSLRFPQILGNGYDVVNRALFGDLPVVLLIALPFLKLAATGTSAASGIPGGLFTPSLFYGALLGGAAGEVVQRFISVSAPPGAYALMGMGAVLAGTTHASVSAVLMIFELTGDYALILPLMLCCVLSAGVARRLEPQSLYTAALKRKQLELPEPLRPSWLKAVRIAGILLPDAASVTVSAPFQKVALDLLDLPAGRDLYVLDGAKRYAGVIVPDHLRRLLPEEAHLAHVIAADVMEPLEPLSAAMTLAEAAARFARTDLDKLPVVHPGTGELMGVVSKGEVLRRARF